MSAPSTESAARYRANRMAECDGATPAADPWFIDGARSYRLLSVRRCVFRVADAAGGWSGNFALHFGLPESVGCHMELDDASDGAPPARLALTLEAFSALSMAWSAMMDAP